jgi:group I intron endonuclease
LFKKRRDIKNAERAMKMLITKEVEITWYKKTKKHYVNKGYIFTNYHDKFMAKVEDLSNGCLAELEVKCDYCCGIFSITYHQYNARNRDIIDKDCCNDCKGLKAAESNIKTGKIKEINASKRISKASQIKYNNFIYRSNYKLIDKRDNGVSGIYRIINKLDGKVYIGSAVNLKCRKNEHYRRLVNNKHHSNHLQNAWNKYGKDNFNFEVIEYVDIIENLIQREQYWMDFYISYDDKYGYNMRPKAESPLGTTKIMPEETKWKISKANSGRIRKDMRIYNNPRCLLTEKQISNIKTDLLNDVCPKEIALEYGVKISYIYDIKLNRKFSYVLPEIVG